MNDIKIILRMHMKVRLYIQSQEEKKLATYGSHENTMEKEKKKNSWSQKCFKDLPKDDDPLVQPSLSFIKDPWCLLQRGCYFALHTFSGVDAFVFWF